MEVGLSLIPTSISDTSQILFLVNLLLFYENIRWIYLKNYVSFDETIFLSLIFSCEEN